MQGLRKFATQGHFLKICIMNTSAGREISQISTDIKSLELLTMQVTALSKCGLSIEMEQSTRQMRWVYNQEGPRLLVFDILRGFHFRLTILGKIKWSSSLLDSLTKNLVVDMPRGLHFYLFYLCMKICNIFRMFCDVFLMLILVLFLSLQSWFSCSQMVWRISGA